MTVGKRLQTARKRAGLTQKALAQKCGLATGTIQQYELDKRIPKNKEIVEKIADTLGISGVYLLWGERGNNTDLEESNQQKYFLNYMDSLGYTFVDGALYDAPFNEIGMLQLEKDNISLPLTELEFEELKQSIENDIDLEIYKFRKEKGI